MPKCPNCTSELGLFTDDPIIPGITRIRAVHILELQARCHQAEIDGGITPLSVFSEISANVSKVRNNHIQEIRSSIEKIMDNDLTTYFNYDYDGNFLGTDRTDWIDKDLVAYVNKIRYLHIEDLRHPLLTTWKETWNFSSSLSNGLSMSSALNNNIQQSDIFKTSLDSASSYQTSTNYLSPDKNRISLGTLANVSCSYASGWYYIDGTTLIQGSYGTTYRPNGIATGVHTINDGTLSWNILSSGVNVVTGPTRILGAGTPESPYVPHFYGYSTANVSIFQNVTITLPYDKDNNPKWYILTTGSKLIYTGAAITLYIIEKLEAGLGEDYSQTFSTGGTYALADRLDFSNGRRYYFYGVSLPIGTSASYSTYYPNGIDNPPVTVPEVVTVNSGVISATYGTIRVSALIPSVNPSI